MEPFSKEWFDDTSSVWRENKRVCKHGYFRYKCEFTFKRGHKCGRDVYKDNNLCRQHWALNKNLQSSDKLAPDNIP
jgi:hypothetical protein